MNRSQSLGARQRAHRILLARTEGSAAVSEEGHDRAVTHDLVLGVRRRLWLLDAILRNFLERPLKATPAPILTALRIGVHDLLFRPGVPGPMVVSETVALAGPRPGPRGLINAVLRKVAGSFEALDQPPEPPTAHDLWVEGDRWMRCSRAILPDPTADPIAWASRHYTLPESIVRAVAAEIPLEAGAFFRACDARLPLALRPNPPLSLDDLVGELREQEVEILATSADHVEIRVRAGLARISALAEGRATAQDQVASEVVPFLGPQPGERILDLCAAPGGKSVQIARALGGKGELVAAHLPGRADHLAENLAPFADSGVRLHDLGPKGEDLPEGEFDRILVDAPCSNSGVLMKRVDARFRLDEKHLQGLIKRQDEVLDRAASRLAPGGCLVYSTCSILPPENQERAQAFLARHSGFRLVEERLRWPHRTGRDGGYAAQFCR